MTVQELIDKLKPYPQDMEVVGSSDRHDSPTELYLYGGHYRTSMDGAEWDEVCGKDVVVINVSY